VAVQVDLQCVPVLSTAHWCANRVPGIQWQNGKLALRMPWERDEVVQCRVLDSRGRILASTQAKSTQGILETTFPKENLGSGLIWLTLSGAQGQTVQFKWLPSSLP
jgi:hypothetical protein